jgi:hypothetical protein
LPARHACARKCDDRNTRIEHVGGSGMRVVKVCVKKHIGGALISYVHV